MIQSPEGSPTDRPPIAAEADRPRGPMPPYLLRRDFLPGSVADSLVGWAIENEARFMPSTVRGERLDPKIRVSVTIGKFGDTKHELRRRMLAIAPDLIRDLHVNSMEVGETELELVAHNDGAFYRRHIDTYTGADARSKGMRFISAVYYVHRKPKGFSGGALRFYRFGGASIDDDFVEIAPEHNLLVVFPSWAAHEVTEISCPTRAFADSRFAVNIWLRAPRTVPPS